MKTFQSLHTRKQWLALLAASAIVLIVPLLSPPDHWIPLLGKFLDWKDPRRAEVGLRAQMADRFTILDRGRTVASGAMTELDDTLVQRYLAV